MNTMRLIPKNWFKRDGECCGSLPASRSRHVQPFTSGMPLYVELDKLFNNFFNSMGAQGEGEENAEEELIRPKVDVSGNEKQYTVTVEMPGVDEKDLRVELENGSLRIHGEKRREVVAGAAEKDGNNAKEEKEDKSGAQTYRLERSYGSFQRTLTLPDDVDTAGITASHKNGVLTVVLPRTEAPKPETRQINIDKA